jgi:uncharacterized lipoprotein YajG
VQTTKLILLVFPLLLFGCAVPVAVSMITGAASVAVNEATGKTVTDHTVSSVNGQDCRISRAFNNQEVCKDETPISPATTVTTTGVVPSSIAELEARYRQTANK